MSIPRIAALIAGLVLAATGSVGMAQEAEPARSRLETDWLQFRHAFPFHMQTIAASKPGDDGTRTVIISEPPPHVTLEALARIGDGKLAGARVRQWGVGFDGWVKDIVVRLPPMKEDAFGELTKELSKYLFFTDYKAFALPLPVDRKALETLYPLDVKVGTAELEDWYAKRKFVATGGGEPRLLEGADEGVYMSQEPGLVVWIVPRKKLEDHKESARKFALDSDLILGAVARKGSVAIFGRERLAPTTVLPPLRTEMILTLAASKGRSLSQSYERMLFAAGSSHARWEWAPIHLSPELLDTEYGSILNLTDQLLKGWTMAGATEYHRFPYPSPTRFPFDGPLIHSLKSNRLIYNWNTTGFGLRSDGATGSIYAISRTGALPLTYRAEGVVPPKNGPAPAPAAVALDPRKAEEQGYSYFATLSDPFLARAVQYSALYQVFKEFGVSTAARKWPVWSQSKALEQVAAHVLKTLREAEDQDIQRAVDAFLDDVRERFETANADNPARAKFNPDRVPVANHLTAIQKLYRKFHDTHKEGGEHVAAIELGMARDFDFQDPNGIEDVLAIRKDAAPVLAAIRNSRVVVRLCKVSDLQAMFSKTRPATANPWLQTPTVVYSRSLGSEARLSGGHNVNPATTKVVRDAGQARGSVRIEWTLGKPEIVCHPADGIVGERQARLIARSVDSRQLKADLETVLRNAPPNVKPQELFAAIGRSTEHKSPERGFSPEHAPKAGGAEPPQGPPSPPGTAPSNDLPPPDKGPTRASYAPPLSEMLFISLEDSRATVRREVTRDGKTEVVSTTHWNQHDLLHGLTKELEAGGRAVDGQPLRLTFEKGYAEKDVQRVMDGLTLHGPRHRSVIRYENAANPNWKATVEKATVVEKSIKVNEDVANGLKGSKLEGTIDAKTEGANAKIEFEVFLVTEKVPGAKAVEGLVEKSIAIQPRERVRLSDLPPRVFENLLKGLDATRTGSTARFKCLGTGDAYITRYDAKRGVWEPLTLLRP